mmetsp:Transcript_34529/g.91682  ORF Transcript_34529/g.91682 Transcript_34529/m.91682 type:complete len:201 (+) Transcript_34529:443-1045(+)
MRSDPVSVIYHDPERVQKRSTESRGARPYVRFVIAARRERTMPRWEEFHTHSHDEFPRPLACSSPTATPLLPVAALPGRRHELPSGCRSQRARVRTDPSCWRPVLNKGQLAAYFVRRVTSAGPERPLLSSPSQLWHRRVVRGELLMFNCRAWPVRCVQMADPCEGLMRFVRVRARLARRGAGDAAVAATSVRSRRHLPTS